MGTDFSSLFDNFETIAIALAVCLPFLIVVPILAFVGYRLITGSKNQKAYLEAAQSWLSTSGTIMSSEIIMVERRSGKHGRKLTKYPDIVYRYEVNGQLYENKVVKAGEQFFSVTPHGGVETVVERYRPGAKVTVYYDPADPRESALER